MACSQLLRAGRRMLSCQQLRLPQQVPRILRAVRPGRDMGATSSAPAYLRRGTSACADSEPPGSDDSIFKEKVQGKSFLCTMCGKCCTGKGQVWISEEDGLDIAMYLGMSHSRFLVEYTKSYKKYDGWRLLKDHAESDDCIFLEQGTTCSIHQVRPLQCRTYPWWPGVVESNEAWEAERENMCEGLGHPEAEPLDEEHAAKMLKKQTEIEIQRKMSYRRRA